MRIDGTQYGQPGNDRQPRIDELEEVMCADQANTTAKIRNGIVKVSMKMRERRAGMEKTAQCYVSVDMPNVV